MPRRHPAEWEPHSACWLAFPRLPAEWPGVFDAVCQEWADLCWAIADVDSKTGNQRGESLEIVVYDEKVQAAAQSYLKDVLVNYHLLPYDDIWLRDTAPVFVQDEEDVTVAVDFEFNVWGHKFDFPNDKLTARAIAKTVGCPLSAMTLVAEGGALETDGQGTLLTTRQCLLNPNRNPALSQSEIETLLRQSCGYQKILWLEGALRQDHTDGHIDTLVRFVMPGVVMVMLPQTPHDPNGDCLKSIVDQLTRMTDARGRSLQLVTIPSPGEILDDAGELVPASYLNFYIGNTTVVVPTFGSSYDHEAIAKIASCFPTRRTVGLSAKALITGGGAFHCVTQQQP